MSDPYAPQDRPGYLPPPGYGQPQGDGQPQGYGQPLYPGWPGPPPQGKSNGFGITSMVLGIISLALFVTNVLAVILGVLALVFGILGRGKVSRREADNGGMALTGIITGSIGATLGLLVIFYYLTGPSIFV